MSTVHSGPMPALLAVKQRNDPRRACTVPSLESTPTFPSRLRARAGEIEAEPPIGSRTCRTKAKLARDELARRVSTCQKAVDRERKREAARIVKSYACSAVPDPNQDKGEGKLGDVASKILMKILYGARYARFDLLRSVNALACNVTKWTIHCDKALHRLISYIARFSKVPTDRIRRG